MGQDLIKVRLYEPLPQQEMYVLRLIRHVVDDHNNGKMFVWNFNSGSWEAYQPNDVMPATGGLGGLVALLPVPQIQEISKQLAEKAAKA